MGEKITTSFHANIESENNQSFSLVDLQNKGLLRSLVVEHFGDNETFIEAMIQKDLLIIEEEPTEDDLTYLISEYNLEGEGQNTDNLELEDRHVTSVEYLLSQIAKHRLLTHEEEKSLSRVVQKGLMARKFLENNPEIDSERLNQLQQDIVDGQKATEEMAKCNGRLVISVAKKYHGMDLLDKIQEGQIGLLKAIKKFDASKGFAFSTYATWWIRQAITRAIHDQGRMIRLPVHAGELLNKSRSIAYLFSQENGRHPTQEELEEILVNNFGFNKVKINLLRFMRLRTVDKNPISLDQPLDEDVSLGEYIPDSNNKDMLETSIAEFTVEELEQLLEGLTTRQEHIIRSRFFDSDKATLQAIALKFKLTRERIRQLEVDALKKLKPSLVKRIDRAKNINGWLLHEQNNIQYEDIVEDVLPKLEPTLARILYRRLYLNLTAHQLEKETKQKAEDIENQYVDGRIQIWDMQNKGLFSDTLLNNLKQLKDLNKQHVKKVYKQSGHLLSDEQRTSFELFFGYETNKERSIYEIAEELNREEITIRSELRSSIILLEGFTLNKRAL